MSPSCSAARVAQCAAATLSPSLHAAIIVSRLCSLVGMCAARFAHGCPLSHCASSPNTCHPCAPVLPVHFAAASLTRVHLATRLCARPSASSLRCSAPACRCRFPFLHSRPVPVAVLASSSSRLCAGLGPSSRVASAAAACMTAAAVSPCVCASSPCCDGLAGSAFRRPRTSMSPPVATLLLIR